MGHWATNAANAEAKSGSRCSALSRTNNARLPRSASATASQMPPGCSSRPSACAIVVATNVESRSGASATQAMPSG